MLEEKTQQSSRSLPSSAVSSEPEIFIMPELGPPAKPLKPRKKIPTPLILGVGGGLLVLILGILAFFVLRPRTEPVVGRPDLAPESLTQPPIIPQTPVALLTPPREAPTTTPPTSPLAPVIPPKILSFGPDDDSDGLTNLEEQLIYKSDALRPDTDNDGFLDGNEVFHLYSPTSPTPVKLLGSGLIQQYDNLEFKYSFFYPSDWEIEQASTSTSRDMLARGTTGELVSLIVTDNIENLALFDWYSREVLAGSITTLEPITTKGGFGALQTANRLTTYVALPGKVLTISLNISEKTQIEYRRTYEMMLNSLAVE